MPDRPVERMNVVILGTDSVREAQPVDWVQLMHACRKLGFDFVAPVTWGEELIATHVGERMADPAHVSVVGCACPLVGRQLRAAPVQTPAASTVAPPVACARYVRAAFHPRPVHVTYAGACPGAMHPEVDAQWVPDVLFARLAEAGIDALSQPRHFENQLPVDRARYASSPGGMPDAEWLAARAGARLIEAAPLTVDVIADAAAEEPVLIDLATSCRCSCARDRFFTRHTEPPRASAPVVRTGVSVTAERVTMESPERVEAIGQAPLPVGESEPRATFAEHGLSAGEAEPPPAVDPSLTMTREPW